MYELEKAWIGKALVSLGVDLSTVAFHDLPNGLHVHIGRGSKSMAFDQRKLDGIAQDNEGVCALVMRELKALVA